MKTFGLIVLFFATLALIIRHVEAGIPCSTWADNPELCNSDLVSKDN